MFLKYAYKKILLKLIQSVIFIVEWDTQKNYSYTENEKNRTDNMPRGFEPGNSNSSMHPFLQFKCKSLCKKISHSRLKIK